METVFMKTPLGVAKISGNHDGITAILIQNDGVVSKEIPATLKTAVIQIQEYFEGKRDLFTFKISPKGTEFQMIVWQALQKIPFGRTISYLELSKNIGNVKAIRAVASANAKNPLWVVIPCHRVIGSDGSLTGYAGGLWRKKWLLDHENPLKQKSLFEGE